MRGEGKVAGIGLGWVGSVVCWMGMGVSGLLGMGAQWVVVGAI